MNTNLKCVVVLYLTLCSSTLFGHDRKVHQAITANAAASAYDSSFSYRDFVSVISSDLLYEGPKGATNFMVFGSDQEDNVYQDVGGFRSLNHFYDPLTGLGLSNLPLDDRMSPFGRDSFTWASTFNCPGINFWIAGYPANVDKLNTRSWQNARDREWFGLTATRQLERQTALGDMFRDVGQVVHLLEDTSSPQHVRNEQHLLGSPIEKYGGGHVNQLVYSQGTLDWRGAGFTKLEDFWNRHLYNGNPSALDADLSGGSSTLGLAEWCNGNFLGDRHIYAEYFHPGDVRYYPLPSLANTVQGRNFSGSLLASLDTETLEGVVTGQRPYIQKDGAGIHMQHHSMLKYLGVRHPARMAAPDMRAMLTIRDDKVLEEYHANLIPRAVKYSAGLLDYFFRGTLGVSVVGQSGLKIKNTSGQDFKDGSFHLFYDDANGNRTEITGFSTTYSGQLSSGSSISGSFAAPVGASKYILVYQGTIGSNNGQPLDPADAGIAIATKGFSPPISVKINLNGTVWLPDYVPDDTYAYADLTLHDGTVQLANLHIYSDSYYDPSDPYSDTYGVANLGNHQANVNIECGKTYDFLLEGNARSVTGSFSQLPAGYTLEWQTPPSGPVVDNKTSQQINSPGASKDFKVLLKPKRIIFTKDSIPPDGVDQTQAKLTFLTGSSGDWFTGNPQWSITGDALGCTIDSNTGWIRAGTETGEITVQAKDSNSPYNYLRAALKIGSSGSYGIGAGVLANVGNALAVSLGVLPCDGSFMGSIRLKLTSPSPSLATPAGLTYDQYNTDNALPEILNETLGVTTTPVRQVLAPQGLADIVTISSTEYEIRLYLPEDAGTKVSGYYAPTGTPFKVWRVASSATDGGGNVTAFIIIEDPNGANIANTFMWNAASGTWTLNGN
jgi:hypothetical protein